MAEISNILTAPASTILDRWFESDILKGTLASDAVIGANVSPHSVGSGYVLMHHVMGEMLEKGVWAYVEGGMGTLSTYLAWLAEQHGADVCVNASVDEILTDKSGSVQGVRLTNGRTIYCKNVVSNCTDPVTFNTMIKEPATIPEDFRNGMNNASHEGVQTKFNLVLKDVPNFTSLKHLNA